METTYKQMKRRHEQESNELFKKLKPFVFYAFGTGQFNEAAADYQAAGGEMGELASAGSGLYGRTQELRQLFALWGKHADEKKRALQDPDFLKRAILHEMGNTEYGWSEDDSAVLDALNLRADELTDAERATYAEARKEFLQANDY